MSWDRKIGKDSVDNRFSKAKMIRQVKLDSLLQSRTPFTALVCDKHFYIAYRIGGARSDNVMLKRLRVFSLKLTKGPVDYFRIEFEENVEDVEYDIPTRTSKDVFHCLCLPYLSIEGYSSDKEDDDPNEEAGETRATKGCLATIIDYQHHKYTLVTTSSCPLCGQRKWTRTYRLKRTTLIH